MDEQMLTVTPLSVLKGYSLGQVIELPPFSEGQPFFARIKRPSLLALVKSGKIPNELLSSVMGIFPTSTQTKKPEQSNVMSEMYDMMEIICEASFVEPSYSQLKSEGIELTDEQKMFVLQYSQHGVKALDSFRKE